MQGKSRQELLEPFPRVQEWMSRVADACAPHHHDVSQVLMKAAAAAETRQKENQSKL